jgi:AcrR family transcriptional regulator
MGRPSAEKTRQVRIGRPRLEQAGDVEDRILLAARSVFVEHGLGGASIDEIARRARASKPTIYARFPSKQALFAAVITRSAPTIEGRFADDLPAEGALEDRLIAVAMLILKRLLTPDTIEFMRLAAAEAQRAQELVEAGRTVRQRAAQAARRLLEAVAATADAQQFPALAVDRLEATTQRFLDLVVAPFLVRALLGEPLDGLHAEIGGRVPQSVGFFLDACRH